MSQEKVSAFKSESMASKAKSKKRPRQADGEASRKKRKPATEQDDSLLDTAAGMNKGVALMDPQLLADTIAQRTTRFGTDLSPVELSDLSISRA
jgi:protein CMS1